MVPHQCQQQRLKGNSSRARSEQADAEVAGVLGRRDCADRELKSRIRSQYRNGVAALAVLAGSHMLQTIPHIVGLETQCT